MSIAPRVQRYLANNHVSYSIIHHAYSEGAIQSAIAAQVPLACMSKAVVVEDNDGRHLMAVIPATNRLHLQRLGELVDRPVKLAHEQEVFELFDDCSYGAIPSFGAAYNLDVVYDDKLASADHVYVEAGDHEDLIDLPHEAFQQLMRNYPHGNLSEAIMSPFDHREGGVINYSRH